MSLKITEKDHIQGSHDAPIVLLEYGDYQCPYCGQAYYVVKDIQKKFGNKISFIFRNFPIQQIHPFAVHAAIASEIAASKGKFWEMHDMLYENQQKLDDGYLLKYAEELGINTDEFEKEFENKKYFQKVQDDYNSGIQNGVQGTPAFFVNGEIFGGNWMERDFIDYLESLI